MPHIILEHNLKDSSLVGKICKALHQKLAEQETVKLSAIKTRSSFVDNLIIGDKETSSFSHVELRLLSGRSEALKKVMGEALLGVLKVALNKGSLSVEVRELESYSKV